MRPGCVKNGNFEPQFWFSLFWLCFIFSTYLNLEIRIENMRNNKSVANLAALSLSEPLTVKPLLSPGSRKI
jgi:hypothetical protein